MKKILILEDNYKSAHTIEEALYKIDVELKVFLVQDIKEAYTAVMNNQIDAFIIDIVLDTKKPGDTSGVKFVQDIRKMNQYQFSPVIFVTSLEDPEYYAYRELHCYAYIEKPYDVIQIQNLVKEALRFQAQTEEKVLYFRKDGILYPVNCKEVVFAESTNHKMCFHFANTTQLTIFYKTCKQFLEEAATSDFVQCNKGTVVNKSYVSNIDITNNVITMKDQSKISIGQAYKKRIVEVFKWY